MKIAIFDQKNSTNETWNTINKLNLQDRFILYKFTKYDDIKTIYERNQDKIEGILFTGSVSYNYFLGQAGLLKIPVMFVENSFENHYLFIISHLMNHPDIPLNEIYIDTFDDNRFISAISDAIPASLMPQIRKDYDCFSPTLIDELYEHILKLWKENKIKIAYVGYNPLYYKLIDEGIPCQYIKLPEETILTGIKNIISQVDLNNMYNNNTVVVLIDFMYKEKSELNINEIEYRQATLFKVLVDYKKTFDNDAEINIIQNLTSFEMSFNKKYLLKAGNDTYSLLDFIEKKYSYDYIIGIGMGNDIIECRNRAIKAINFASNFGDRCSFLIKNAIVKGPINSTSCLEIPLSAYEKNKQISKIIDVSNSNFTRIMALFEKYKEDITSNTVAQYLNITERSANRIISNLVEKEIIKEQIKGNSNFGKGRPTKYYRINI